MKPFMALPMLVFHGFFFASNVCILCVGALQCKLASAIAKQIKVIATNHNFS